METNRKDAQQLAECLNLLNQYAPQLIQSAKKMLDPFIGKQIKKVDGSWRKAVNWQNPHVKDYYNGNHFDVHAWAEQKYNYVTLHIKICYNGGKYDDKTYFCIYQETTVDLYTADNDGNIGLLEIDLSRFDIRYNPDEIIQQNDKVKAMAEELEKEIRKIPYQFRNVLYTPQLR